MSQYAVNTVVFVVIIGVWMDVASIVVVIVVADLYLAVFDAEEVVFTGAAVVVITGTAVVVFTGAAVAVAEIVEIVVAGVVELVAVADL